MGGELAAHGDDGQIGDHFYHDPHERLPVHMRHLQVGEHRAHVTLDVRELKYRVRAVGCGHDLKTQGGQHGGGHVPRERFVVHEQKGGPRAEPRAGSGRVRGRGGLVRPGERLGG